MMAPGKAARARFSPSALLLAYCAGEFSSAPIADIWMKSLRPGGARRLGGGLRAKGMHRVEALGAGGIEHAREVDHRVGALAGRGERGRIAHIGLHHHDLPGIA